MNQYSYNDQADYQTGPRRQNIASRNASSFDIISFNPESQGNSKDQDRLDKKQKQAAYRDQLDSMVSNKNDQKRTQRGVTEEYNQGGYGGQNYQSERKVEQKYGQQDNDEAYAQDKKKRMLQEINEANRRAAQNKADEKKRQKADEKAADYQRNQDSLSQYERDDFRQRENKRMMNEENTKALGYQVREFNDRKQEQNYTPSYDSVDRLHYSQNDRDSRNPLAPSYSKMNQDYPPSIDNLSSKMDQLSTSCPFARDDGNNYQEQKHYGRKRIEEPQRNNIDNASQYQKNKGRAQYGGYNIINHQG